MCKGKFVRIHEFLVTILKNQEGLKKEAKKLNKHLTIKINDCENAQKHQQQNFDTLKELDSTIQNVKKKMESVEESKGILKNEIHQLENDKTDLESALIDRENQE